MHYAARIAFNSANWHHPTGEAKHYETRSFVHEFGFGHEEWLFRTEWLIDGWRYSFVQGVNDSYERLLKTDEPFELTLFTIEPDKRRRYVAYMSAVECLSDRQAEDVLHIFQQRGWHRTMQNEVQAVNGDVASLGTERLAKHLLNIRFRFENVVPFAFGSYAQPEDKVSGFDRYLLYRCSDIRSPIQPQIVGNSGLSNTQPFRRSGTDPIECTPEHARMQVKLMEELRAEYPGAQVEREHEFVDVRVDTGKELILFEIKSDLEPKAVIRQALGQILEYAYHPSRSHPFPVRLVIVGRRPLKTADESYLDHLKSQFALPLAYRFVEI